MKRFFTIAVLYLLFLLSLKPQPITAHSKAAVERLAWESPSTTPVWKVEGSDDGYMLGAPVRSAGDVNGDGYADVIVAIPYSGLIKHSEGNVQLYLGSATGISQSPIWSKNGDQAGATFGYSIDCAGDVNGDGYSDIIIGAPSSDNGEIDEGQAYVYYGSSSGLKGLPDWTVESNNKDASFGYSVSSAGDINGDGYDDVAVGAPRYHQDEYTVNQGRMYIYFGSPGGLNTAPGWIYTSEQSNSWLGESISYGGDVNGDGYSDVIVNDKGGNSNGRTMIFFGQSGGPGVSPNWVVEGGKNTYPFDNRIGGGMDVNGDGYDDVIVSVGSPFTQNTVNVYYGSASGPGALPDWTDQSISSTLGSVGSAGDFNGDGYEDIIIGAPTFSNGEYSEGKVYVYFGSELGLGDTFGWAVESNIASSYFGASADAIGEGHSDLIIGAPNYSNDYEFENGAAFIYLGSHSEFNIHLPLIQMQ